MGDRNGEVRPDIAVALRRAQSNLSQRRQQPGRQQRRQHSLAQQLEEELDRLETLGIISRIEHSEWGTPLVTVLKKNGSLRVCADYSVTVNKFLDDVNYPLPRIDDLFQALQGGRHFSKIDLSRAFNQLAVDDQTASVLTWSTHRGLYKVHRLPFGCKPNSGIFQAKIDSVLLGCAGTVAFIDDIVVTGRNDDEHLTNLESVLDRLQKAGLKVNKEKCNFFKKQITYLGFRIDASGLHKDPGKVDAIVKMPSPKDRTQARSFCGLVLYYGRFIPKASIILKPIFNAIANEKFTWNNECANAMSHIRDIIISDLVLSHYNPNFPLILMADASQYGIGACIVHKLADGQERPIAFASRTLNKAETNYSMIDKEALAIYYGICKFKQYLLGRKFVIKTDHRPLTAIFGSKKGIPMMAANRLQRWAIFLSAFDFDIKCIPGKDNGCADGLSRLCLNENTQIVNEDYTYLNFLSENFQRPINCADVAKESLDDPILGKVIEFTLKGWPNFWKGRDEIREFFLKRDELTIERGILMWGHRTVIPAKFRTKLLNEIHCSHMGIVKSKALTRSYFWWPGLDKSIESMIGNCAVCRENRQNPRKVQIVPWPKSDRPFNRVHIDYCGPINGDNFLIVIDSFSKWLEVCRTRQITARKTIDLLKPIFARFGIPSVLVSDNAPSFTSYEFEHFCEISGIKHITSAPYHPASNGQAENSVKTFKTAISKMLNDTTNEKRDIENCIETFLCVNRNSVHSDTGKSPYQLMFNRDPILRWKSLLPKFSKTEQVSTRIKNVKNLCVGDTVYAKNFMSGKWEKGEVVEILGVNTYVVLYNGKKYKKHANHITPFSQEKNGKGNNKICDKHETKSYDKLTTILKRNIAAPSLTFHRAIVQSQDNHNEIIPRVLNSNEPCSNSVGTGRNVSKTFNSKDIRNTTDVVDSHCRKSNRLSKKPNRLDL